MYLNSRREARDYIDTFVVNTGGIDGSSMVKKSSKAVRVCKQRCQCNQFPIVSLLYCRSSLMPMHEL